MKAAEVKAEYLVSPSETSVMEREIIAGLSHRQKQIPAKYFYDLTGSELFEQITQLEEYYPTRAEMDIFLTHSDAIARQVGPIHTLIEFGSGSSRKIKALISSFASLKEYIPIDISKEFLLHSAAELARQFPHVSILPVHGDYSLPLDLPIEEKGRRAIFFPGSTIGNFEPHQAKQFLETSAQFLNEGDGFIIGIDMKKDRSTLEAAYNDQKGVTAAFNLNVLSRLNRELGADFDLNRFQHVAFYNEEQGRIEMHLKSCCKQQVRVASRVIELAEGETLHTENSYKYSIEEFQQLARQSGFQPEKVWTDRSGVFSVHYLEKS